MLNALVQFFQEPSPPAFSDKIGHQIDIKMTSKIKDNNVMLTYQIPDGEFSWNSFFLYFLLIWYHAEQFSCCHMCKDFRGIVSTYASFFQFSVNVSSFLSQDFWARTQMQKSCKQVYYTQSPLLSEHANKTKAEFPDSRDD